MTRQEFAEPPAAVRQLPLPHCWGEEPRNRLTYLVCANLGTGLAGSLFTCLLVLCAVTIRAFAGDYRVVEFPLVLIHPLLAAALGGVITMCGGLLCATSIHLVNKSLGYPLRPLTAAATSGGLTGFLLTTLLVSGKGLSPHGLLLSILAMVLGQATTMWYAHRFVSPPAFQPKTSSPRFKISHVLMTTLWISMLLAVCRLMDSLYFAWLLGRWAMLQGISLWIAAQLAATWRQRTLPAASSELPVAGSDLMLAPAKKSGTLGPPQRVLNSPEEPSWPS